MKDHYRTLGVASNASEQEIKLAYRRLAKRYHPDVNAGANGAEEKFKEITEAYSILSDFGLRNNYDSKRNRPLFYEAVSTPEKKDPRRKEYSEEELEWARTRHKKRTLANIARRKNILKGMVITFILFMASSAGFEYWIEKKREKESRIMTLRLDSLLKQSRNYEKTEIESMDSPFDPIFGAGVYVSNSKNKFYVFMPFSDAVICAVQSEWPFRTIRNEFIHAQNGFVMKGMPDGEYYFKLYTGKKWDVKKKNLDGRVRRILGGFTKDEMFFKVESKPYRLQSDFKKNRDTITFDTITISPRILKLTPITKEEFFDPGK